ncbi:Bacteriophage A118-like holin, Hol118 [Terribacillus halophilus]|uniref:Bacteriophage A118-like holin, Hol118 n=1 Tax=Terribacillus halophilus TaxID=361279 RepID=A0A1G6J7G4_9BACI|nr:Bacteriophage A118-like holin, Hol118 [Terribacillus halophilus]
MDPIQNETMYQVLVFATILAPIVTAMMELLKRSFPRLVPYHAILSVVVGALLGAAAYPFTDFELAARLWAGGIAGLASTGLYNTLFSRKPPPDK